MKRRGSLLKSWQMVVEISEASCGGTAGRIGRMNSAVALGKCTGIWLSVSAATRGVLRVQEREQISFRRATVRVRTRRGEVLMVSNVPRE